MTDVFDLAAMTVDGALGYSLSLSQRYSLEMIQEIIEEVCILALRMI